MLFKFWNKEYFVPPWVSLPPPEQLLRGGLAGGESKNSPACFIWPEIRCPARKSRIIQHVLQGMTYNMAGYWAVGNQQEKEDPAQPSFFWVWFNMSELYKTTYIHVPAITRFKLPLSQFLKGNDCVPSKSRLPMWMCSGGWLVYGGCWKNRARFA